jgi:hypothetical protein
LVENVDFGAVGAYLDLPAAAYTLGFDVNDDKTPDLIFSLPALAGGTIANVFAVNDAQGNVFLNAQLQDSNTARIDPLQPVEPGQTEIRVIHLSPDAPGVDIWVNGSIEAVSDLAFGEGTGYLTLDEGTYDFGVAPAGTSAADSVLNINGLQLMADKRYTAVAYNSLANIRALALGDDFTDLSEQSIRVRPIHTAAGVGQVDVWNIPATGEPSLLYEDLDFGNTGDYIDLPAAAYTLGFDVNNDAVPDAIFEIPALSGGTIANVFAVANTEGRLTLEAQTNTGTIASVKASIASVRVLHISPDAPAVDLLINDSIDPAVQELSFGESTGYLEVVPGQYDFFITPAGKRATDAVLNLRGFDLMSNRYYTAVAFDELAGIKALWLEDDYRNLEEGYVRVRAIHTAFMIGQVDIWALFDSADPVPLYENVDFGVAGNTLDLPADAYSLGFDVNDDSMPDVVFDLPALLAGTVANVFAVNDLGGSVFLLAQFEDGTLARIDHR